jgi:hypothetical protein
MARYVSTLANFHRNNLATIERETPCLTMASVPR